MKRKISVGQIISIIGTLVISIGLICNGFELVPVGVFRAIALVGIALQVVALVLILSRKEI